MCGYNESSQYEEYLAGHKRRARLEEKSLAARKREAWEKAKQLAEELPLLFPLRRIYLFGSLTGGHFTTLSDIDIALEGLEEKDHLKALTAAENIARPFQVDVILLEEAPLSLKKKIYNQGVIIYERGKD
ncbi:nucleotidyltransferase family protein [Desulfofundulus thermosubterraneus]|uniref:Predicted nucleotidyltransferase n=1 Tax=Desulfofundulus thermosubterraneus DSM 16057 TaxID=1121432 RepID=A0A1M6JTA6_9FIRM|nr:nucleotidyltransferase domain-containing protein [Desulfofundulus thermosubterraneus]SHJ49901.1 Predicted nucleotidyltransferase [Desulfofundulus thermosubterraneus DSM 16057]